jgi:hypothetical protein
MTEEVSERNILILHLKVWFNLNAVRKTAGSTTGGQGPSLRGTNVGAIMENRGSERYGDKSGSAMQPGEATDGRGGAKKLEWSQPALRRLNTGDTLLSGGHGLDGTQDS